MSLVQRLQVVVRPGWTLADQEIPRKRKIPTKTAQRAGCENVTSSRKDGWLKMEAELG